MTPAPQNWIDAANAAGLTLDMIDVEPREALIDAARRYEIPDADLERFVAWAEDYAG